MLTQETLFMVSFYYFWNSLQMLEDFSLDDVTTLRGYKLLY